MHSVTPSVDGLSALPTLAIYLPDLSGGGTERLHLGLSRLFAPHGIVPRFLIDQWAGTLIEEVPREIPIETLQARRQLDALPKLIRYLRGTPPDVLIVNMEHMAVMAIAARLVARAPTRIIVTQHNSLAQQLRKQGWQWRLLPPLFRWALRRADAVVCVSHGVADELVMLTGIARSGTDVIYNGVVGEEFLDAAQQNIDDPLCPATDEPMIVAIGRFVPQKDFVTLISAFGLLVKTRPARLVILGEGPQRAKLEAMVASLGLRDCVYLPGFSTQAPAWLARADLFVLSSLYEGFGIVVAEALAVGTQVVSTDCPHGPAEILEQGRHGRLVRPGDVGALAEAMAHALATPDDPVSRAARIDRGRGFSLAKCAAEYAALVHRLAGKEARSA